jgi:NodT family efflux transporter outer membrane factor (OMF) lipoprotein
LEANVRNPTEPQGRLLLAALLLGLAGCAAGPDYVRPAVPQPAALTRDALPAGTAGPVVREWWKAFGSPELDRLVAQALARNPSIEAAQASLLAARENVIAQRGFFFPTVQFGYNVSRQNVGSSLSPPLASGDTIYNYHTAQLSVSYAPDVFGANRRQVEGLRAAEEGQRYQLEAARLTLASNLVAAALLEATLVEQIGVVEQAIAATQEQLRYSRNLQRNGYASGIDVANQENLLTQMQQALPPLQKQVEQTRDLMAVLGGQTPDARLSGPSFAAISLPPLPQAVASQLVALRPDVKAAETQVQAASAAVGVAQAARLPQFSITGSLGGGATSFGNMFAAGNTVWALGAGLLQPLFSGGTLAARQRAAQAELDAAAAQYRGVVLAAFQNVADTLYALDIDKQALRVAQAGEAAARTTHELTESQVRQGYSSQPAALAARQAWLQARAARISAYGTLLGDTVALYQALGGGVLAQDSPAP